jgi:hypothetical protein
MIAVLSQNVLEFDVASQIADMAVHQNNRLAIGRSTFTVSERNAVDLDMLNEREICAWCCSDFDGSDFSGQAEGFGKGFSKRHFGQ